jgi:hypothetical protein
MMVLTLIVQFSSSRGLIFCARNIRRTTFGLYFYCFRGKYQIPVKCLHLSTVLDSVAPQTSLSLSNEVEVKWKEAHVLAYV